MSITLYTARACPYCIIVKRFLEKNNIDFKEIDITLDKSKEEEMKEKSKQSQVPVVDANGTIVIGYNLKKLKEALNIK
ncbi:MAG: glutaredoxin family protein [Candidatus Nanoarchaeia archaeon]